MSFRKDELQIENDSDDSDESNQNNQLKKMLGIEEAGEVVEEMEDQGVVSQANHVGKREILVPEQY